MRYLLIPRVHDFNMYIYSEKKLMPQLDCWLAVVLNNLVSEQIQMNLDSFWTYIMRLGLSLQRRKGQAVSYLFMYILILAWHNVQSELWHCRLSREAGMSLFPLILPGDPLPRPSGKTGFKPHSH